MNDMHRAIIERIVSDAVGVGYALDVFNGQDTTIRHSRDEREIMAALASTGEDELRFRRDGKRVGVVHLVYGNDGWGVAQAFTPILEPVMVGARKVAEGVFSR